MKSPITTTGLTDAPHAKLVGITHRFETLINLLYNFNGKFSRLYGLILKELGVE
jgi:hypothetical protein